MSAAFIPRRRKLSADQFERVGRAGILGEEVRVELIEGDMIEMAPIGSRHASAVNTLSMFLARAVGNAALVSTQNPLRLSEDSEPQPDLMLLRPSPDRYRSALPRPEDVLLLIEVADTTLDYDCGTKLPLYAKHGICEAWILDLEGMCLVVYRQPSGSSYGHGLVHGRMDSVAPAPLPTVTLQLRELFA